ncbi:MAG: glycosyltransferase family 4 protein [Planctomycetota bacterium]|nr:glycosyltransferase family 4 protein [Planctomycetota bacterium]
MRILFLQKRLLYPSNTGGKIRTLNVLRHLASWHDVTYLCNIQPDEQPHAHDMERLGVKLIAVPWNEARRRSVRFAGSAIRNLLSPCPFNVDKDYNPELRQRAAEIVSSAACDLLVCDFVQMARNCLGLKIPKLLFQHNVECEIFRRQSMRASGLWSRYLGSQAGKMERFEKLAGNDFDRIIAVSERDRKEFQKLYGWNHVDVIDTAVDVDYFSPDPSSSRVSNQVVFIGSMDWPPNVEGVHHFVNKIWPLVVRENPDARFQIVGRNPSESVWKLAAIPGIEVTGTVKDTRPFLQSAAVSVVPVYSGSGTRLKIFESMAMMCPVVSSPLGAEGLDVEHNQHVLLCEDDRAMATGINRLLTDPQEAHRISKHALELVRERFTTERVARQFELSCKKTIAAWRMERSGQVNSEAFLPGSFTGTNPDE